ncbi:MAG: cupin domain-containing protein [Pararhizobium sp.]
MALKMLFAELMAVAVRVTPLAPRLAGPKEAGKQLSRQAAGRRQAMIASPAMDLPMLPSPINPDWIVAGAPVARLAEHSRSHDDAAVTAMWDCTAGEFNWYFGWDETVVILEGEVHVTAEDGTETTLRAGDIGFFNGGTWANWRIETYVRKIAFCRKKFPEPVVMAYRLRDLLRGEAPKAALAA